MSVESGRRLIEFDEAQKFRNDKFLWISAKFVIRGEKGFDEELKDYLLYYVAWALGSNPATSARWSAACK